MNKNNKRPLLSELAANNNHAIQKIIAQKQKISHRSNKTRQPGVTEMNKYKADNYNDYSFPDNMNDSEIKKLKLKFKQLHEQKATPNENQEEQQEEEQQEEEQQEEEPQPIQQNDKIFLFGNIYDDLQKLSYMPGKTKMQKFKFIIRKNNPFILLMWFIIFIIFIFLIHFCIIRHYVF